MNPLERIKTWLETFSGELQIEIIAHCGIFHPDKQVSLNWGETQLNAFKDYLIDKSLDEKETVTRTLLIIGLIDFALSGKDSEEGWTEAVDTNLYLGARAKEAGMSTEFIDRFFESLERRKETWFEISRSWNLLKETELSKQAIFKWWSLSRKK